MQKCGKTHKTTVLQEIQEQEDIEAEGAEVTTSKRSRDMKDVATRKNLTSRRLDNNEESHQGRDHKTEVAT